MGDASSRWLFWRIMLPQAAAVVATLPILALYFAEHKYVVRVMVMTRIVRG